MMTRLACSAQHPARRELVRCACADAGRDGSGTARAPRHPREPPGVGGGCGRRQDGDRRLRTAAGSNTVDCWLTMAKRHALHYFILTDIEKPEMNWQN